MAEQNVNYTAELTEQIVMQYQEGVAVETIAEAIGKSVRSVRSKLVREGVYVKAEAATKPKQEGPTKKELLRNLEATTGFSAEGLEGATKAAIIRIMQALQPVDA